MSQNDTEQYIGYLKYSGDSIHEGLLDARKAGEALVGFDEIIRFFLFKEKPEFEGVEIEFPVRIRRGSWEALIPDVLEKLFTPGGVAATIGTTYGLITATKAATGGFHETGLAKDIKSSVKNAIKAAQWVIKISSHIRTIKRRKFTDVKIPDVHSGIMDIPNEAGRKLSVPKKYFDLYLSCPKNLFSKNVAILDEDKIMELGVIDNGKKEYVSITHREKGIYYEESEADESIILPELKHGQWVDLEGEITRVTESANTIGFSYNDHTIICRPVSGNMAQYKPKIISRQEDHVFPKVRISGSVDRLDKKDSYKEKRPEIIFSDILMLENDKDDAQKLFD